MIAKSQTTADIIEWRKANPEMTMTEIARKVGRSRERVRQILAREGIPTHIPYLPENHCVDCGKTITPYQQAKRCRKCASHYRFRTTIVKLICAQCGAEITRTSGTMACQARTRERRGLPPQTRRFCNRVCQGRYVGAHYGVGRPKGKERRQMEIRVRVNAARTSKGYSTEATFEATLDDSKEVYQKVSWEHLEDECLAQLKRLMALLDAEFPREMNA